MEHEQTEQSLQINENKFRTLVESLPQKIFLKTKESVYLYCNENFARYLNLRAWEIFGKTDYDLFPKEVAEKKSPKIRKS
jgi:PAS domain-containing protein